MNDYNPDEPFEGLGILGWLKVIFRTRAQTIRQSDNMTRLLFDKCNEARAEADQATQALQRMSPLVVLQHRALELAEPVIRSFRDTGFEDEQVTTALNEVKYAIDLAKERL